VVLLVIYINLAVRGSVRFLGEPYRLMKPTLLLWILVLLGGAFIYLGLYPPI
jgi:putative membrane protein